MKPLFTICALLYGNYPYLTKRCLDSIVSLPDCEKWQLRIGMNGVSTATVSYVELLCNAAKDKNQSIIIYHSDNIGKYPAMRKMLYDPVNPIESKFVMWFDDDSYLKCPTASWLETVETAMFAVDMCGHLLMCDLGGNQPIWITQQPWYRGKPLIYRQTVPPIACVPQFAAGGWWVIRTDVLRDLKWPPLNIVHRGGDYMLGEALRQNGFRLRNFTQEVAINADAKGTNDKAERRGLSPLPCGWDYDPPLTVCLHDATKSIDAQLLDYPGL